MHPRFSSLKITFTKPSHLPPNQTSLVFYHIHRCYLYSRRPGRRSQSNTPLLGPTGRGCWLGGAVPGGQGCPGGRYLWRLKKKSSHPKNQGEKCFGVKKKPELSILQGSRFCSLSHTWINYSTTSHDTILEQITFLRLFRKMNKTLQDQQIGIQLDQAKPFFRTHQKSTNG